MTIDTQYLDADGDKIKLARPALLDMAQRVNSLSATSATTIANLKLVDKTKFSRAFVLGYYAAGDGGGGTYYYDAADTTSADNGGTIIVATDGGRWKLAQSSGVTLRQFGAVGDGTADDTTIVQSAITAMSGSKGRLVVPSGTFLCSTLTISSSLIIEGSSDTSIIKQKASTSGNLINVTGSGINVVVRGVTFDGNQANQSAQTLNTIIHTTATGGASLSDVFSILVEQCEFRNPAYCSVRIQGDNDPATREIAWILNNRFVNGSEGVTNPSEDYNPRDIACDDAVEVWVENNVFDSDSAPTVGRSAVVVQQTQTASERRSELHVIGNRINRRGCNTGEALGVIDLYIWGAQCVVRDNVIKNSLFSAVKWKQNGTHISIIGNKIDTSPTTAPALNGNNPTYGSANDLCIVEGNQISQHVGGTAGVIVVSGYFSATTDYSRGIVVRNNQLFGCSGWQIQAAECNGPVIEGNQIFTSSGTVGINVSVNNDGYAVICNNVIDSCSSYSILTYSTNKSTFDAKINGNIFSGSTSTYAALISGRNVSFNDNKMHGCVNGVTFRNTTTLVTVGNQLTSFSGTVGFLIGISGAPVTNYTASGNQTVDITNGVFYNDPVTSKRVDGNSWQWVTGTPASGYWNVGDRLYNASPTAGGMIGWVCTTAGAPGIWKTFGAISA